jgi:hypothetical protein
VPSASHASTSDAATNATNATNATTAGSAPIAKLTYVTASVAVPGTTTPTPATASCPAGTSVLGGGGQVADEADGFIVDDFPVGKTGWTTNFDSSVATTGTTTAICAPAASTAP